MELNIIMHSLSQLSKGSVLDVGCGDGYLSSLLSDYFQEVVATDIRRAERSDIQQVVSDVLALPFASRSFDCVLLSNILEHVGDRKTAVEECLRVLKKGGALVITVPSVVWKLATVFAYPIDLVSVAVSDSCSGMFDPCESCSDRNQEPSRLNARKLIGYLFPRIHGMYDGNWEELLSYQKSSWEILLQSAGVNDAKFVKLPLYPFRYCSSEGLRKALERLGFSSSNCFIARNYNSFGTELDAES